MSRLVLDASGLVEYLLRTSRGGVVEAALRQRSAHAAVPSLCDVEVAAALRRSILRGRATPERCAQAISDYSDLPLERHGHLLLLPRVLELRDNFSAYDAVYVALAERLDGTLVTCDGALTRAIRRHLQIDVIGPSNRE